MVNARGNAYVNTIGYDFPGGEPAPGSVALVSPGGAARLVAGDLAFPNGMAITADGATLVVAESHANRLTAYAIGPDGGLDEPAGLGGHGDDHPDGICVDAEGAIWYADVANRHCVRVREGGEILAAVELDRGAFACALSRGGRSPSCTWWASSGAARRPKDLRGRSSCSLLPPPGAGPSGAGRPLAGAGRPWRAGPWRERAAPGAPACTAGHVTAGALRPAAGG